MRYYTGSVKKNSRRFIIVAIMVFLLGLFCENQKITPDNRDTDQGRDGKIPCVPRIGQISPPISIHGDDASRDWNDCPWVNGTGTWDDPYLIQDLIIDGQGINSCIQIYNTTAYFRIENCTVLNSGRGLHNAGIFLSNASNGEVRENTCAGNWNAGIALTSSAKNNTINNNTCTNNSLFGIFLLNAENNTLLANNCSKNAGQGIYLQQSNNCTLVNNTCSDNTGQESNGDFQPLGCSTFGAGNGVIESEDFPTTNGNSGGLQNWGKPYHTPYMFRHSVSVPPYDRMNWSMFWLYDSYSGSTENGQGLKFNDQVKNDWVFAAAYGGYLSGGDYYDRFNVRMGAQAWVPDWGYFKGAIWQKDAAINQTSATFGPVELSTMSRFHPNLLKWRLNTQSAYYDGQFGYWYDFVDYQRGHYLTMQDTDWVLVRQNFTLPAWVNSTDIQIVRAILSMSYRYPDGDVGCGDVAILGISNQTIPMAFAPSDSTFKYVNNIFTDEGLPGQTDFGNIGGAQYFWSLGYPGTTGWQSSSYDVTNLILKQTSFISAGKINSSKVEIAFGKNSASSGSGNMINFDDIILHIEYWNKTAESNAGGIHLTDSNFCFLEGNNCTANPAGAIISDYASNNTFLGNNFYANVGPGLKINQGGKNNTFVSNNFTSNTDEGMILNPEGDGNLIYLNRFLSNGGGNVKDDAMFNRWDNGSLGNFYGDYSGVDLNDDCVGDTPYLVTGGASAQDYYPLWNDGDDSPPALAVISPTPGQINGTLPPSFKVTVYDLTLDVTGYTLNSVNTTFLGTDGLIDSGVWNSLLNGTHVVTFFANDSFGRWSIVPITIHKDIEAPTFTSTGVTAGQLIGNNTPGFDLAASEGNPSGLWWFSFDSGATNTSCSQSDFLVGWNLLPNGTVTIRFFTNDTAGNLGWIDISLERDCAPPDITSTGLTAGISFTGAPAFALAIAEANRQAVWYSVDGGATNHTLASLTGSVDAAAWASLSAGNVAITFWTNDTLGNTASVTVVVVKATSGEHCGECIDLTLYWVIGGIIAAGAVVGIAVIIKKRKNRPFYPKEGPASK